MKLPAFARISAIALLAIGCTSAPAASVAPSVAPSVSPTATTATTPPTSTPVAEPTGSPRATQPPPPSGALGYSDFADVGWLGSYCWQGTCADVPEMPDSESLPQITVPLGRLTFSLDGAGFVHWIAMYGADGDSLQPLDEGGAPFDPDVSTPSPDEVLGFAELDSPPPGDWVVTVQAFMPDGDAMYAWHVIVE